MLLTSSTTSRSLRRLLTLAASAATGTALVLTTGGSSQAATVSSSHAQVLHYYLVNQTEGFLTRSGRPFTPSPAHPIRPGDQQVRTDLLYAGDAAHHASAWSASDRQVCTFDEQFNLVCQGEAAVRGSLILFDVTLTHPTARVRAAVVGGTGAYAGASGKLVAIQPSPTSSVADVTITLHGV